MEKQNQLLRIGYNDAGSRDRRNPITHSLTPMQRYTKENKFPPGALSEMDRNMILSDPQPLKHTGNYSSMMDPQLRQ